MSTARNSTRPTPAQWRSIVVRSVATLLILALLLFVPAGTMAWIRGWLLLLVFVALMVVAAHYLWRVNPAIFAARSKIHEGTERWDGIMLGFLFAAMLAIVPVASLDDGRFHWSRMSWSFVGLGYLLLVTGMVITAWAQAVKPAGAASASSVKSASSPGSAARHAPTRRQLCEKPPSATMEAGRRLCVRRVSTG